MAEQQPLDFNAWARERRGMRGQMADTAENRRLMLDLQRGYGDYLKQFEPASVQKAKLSDGSVVDVVNGQVVRDARPKFETFVDDKGFVSRLNLDTGLVERVTNSTGQPVKQMAKKAGGFMFGPDGQILPAGMMEPEATPSPTPEAAMTNSMAFQGVPSRGAYETNMPTGVAAPAMAGAMGGGGGITMTPAPAPTNAPAPASSGFASAEEVLAAAKARQLDPATAQKILVEQFGFDP